MQSIGVSSKTQKKNGTFFFLTQRDLISESSFFKCLRKMEII